MNELLDFATRLIELEGGAVEHFHGGASALLPDALVDAWQSPEELELTASAHASAPLAYGSVLLERMIQTATYGVPVVHFRLDQDAVRLTQARSAAEQWTLRNGVVTDVQVKLGPQTRLWVDALATLHGDEKREMLVAASVSVPSGAVVHGFGGAAFGLRAAEGALLPSLSGEVLARAVRACVREAEEGATAFRAAMTRRFERDRLRIEGYFEDLLRELDKRAAKGRLDSTLVEEKRRAILADRTKKLEALVARFVLRAEVQPIALRFVELTGGWATVTLKRRKATRTITLEYDAATRRMVAYPCDACGAPALRPAACDDALHLLCETCVPRAEGRIACRACQG